MIKEQIDAFYELYENDLDGLLKDISNYPDAVALFEKYKLDPFSSMKVQDKAVSIRPLFSDNWLPKTDKGFIKVNAAVWYEMIEIGSERKEIRKEIEGLSYEKPTLNKKANPSLDHRAILILAKIFPATEENLKLFNKVAIKWVKQNFLSDFLGPFLHEKKVAPFTVSSFSSLKEDMYSRMQKSIDNTGISKNEFLKNELSRLEKLAKENYDRINPYIRNMPSVYDSRPFVRIGANSITFNKIYESMIAGLPGLEDQINYVYGRNDSFTIAESLIYREWIEYQAYVRRLLKDSGDSIGNKFTLNQIALIYRYNDDPITRNNCNYIANKYGYKSGTKLYEKYRQLDNSNQRTAIGKYTVRDLEIVIQHLTGKAKKMAIDELKIAKSKNS